MGSEIKKVLNKSALFFILLTGISALIALAGVLKGKDTEVIIKLTRFIFIQGWSVVTIMLSAHLGIMIFSEESRSGAWEYLGTFPKSPLSIFTKKILPGLTTVIIWCGAFAVLTQFSIPVPLLKSGFSSPLLLLTISLSWLLLSGITGIIDEKKNMAKHLTGWFTILSTLLFLWIVMSETGGNSLHKFPDIRSLKDIFVTANLKTVRAEGSGTLSLLLGISFLPLVTAFYKSINPVTADTPARFISNYIKFAFPLYLLPWIYLAGTLVSRSNP